MSLFARVKGFFKKSKKLNESQEDKPLFCYKCMREVVFTDVPWENCCGCPLNGTRAWWVIGPWFEDAEELDLADEIYAVSGQLVTTHGTMYNGNSYAGIPSGLVGHSRDGVIGALRELLKIVEERYGNRILDR